MIDTSTLPGLLGQDEGTKYAPEVGQVVTDFVEHMLSSQDGEDLTDTRRAETEKVIDAILSTENPRSTLFIIGNVIRFAMLGHATSVIMADSMFGQIAKKVAMKHTREELEFFTTSIARTLEQFRCHPHAVMQALETVNQTMDEARKEQKAKIQLVDSANETLKH